MKGKDMILNNFLSRQKCDDSNTHEIMPILFNMQDILQSWYYNLGEGKVGKYLAQIRSQAKSSSIKLPEVHGVEKGLDLNILQEKQVLKWIVVLKAKEVSQIKLRLGQGRAGLRHKIKTPVPLLINKPIVQVTEKPVEQPQIPVPKTSRIQDKIVPVPDYATPHIRSRDESGSRRVNRKSIQDINRELHAYPDPTYRPPPKLVKSLMPEVPRS